MTRLVTATAMFGLLCCIPVRSRAEPSSPRADSRCALLLEQASSQLAAEQYPTMLRTAEDRQRLCPGAVSEFLVGLAQANMFDNQLADDPAKLELLRRHALQSLEIAAVGGDALEPMWRFTVHDWIVRLRKQGPYVDEGDGEDTGWRQESAINLNVEEVDQTSNAALPLVAPPPAPRPGAPWGPLITATAGGAALIGALVTQIAANNRNNVVDRAVAELVAATPKGQPLSEDALQKINALHDEASTLQTWSTGLLVVGSAAVLTGLVWYLFLQPEGGWQWAAMPTAVSARGTF